LFLIEIILNIYPTITRKNQQNLEFTKYRIVTPLPPAPIQDIVESLPPPLVNIPGLHHWLIVFYPGIISKR
jgi:hypothetical protein